MMQLISLHQGAFARRTVVLLMLFQCHALFSQSAYRFADSTAQWNFLHFQYYFLPSGYSYSNIEFVVEKDTIIPPFQYQKISSVSAIPSPSFIRQDSTHKVYVIPPNRNGEYNIYDFSRASGDTFFIEDAWIPNASDLSVRVDSVDNVLLGNKLRKRMYVTLQNWSPDIWIEGIGSLYSSFLSPGVQWDWLDGEGRKLLCYFENDLRLYHNDDYPDTCYYNPTVISVEESDGLNLAHLLPMDRNLWSIAITTTSEINIYFELVDLSGKVMFHQRCAGASPVIDLNHLAKGLYLYQLKSNSGQSKAGKILIR